MQISALGSSDAPTLSEGNRAATALYEHAGLRSFGLEPDAIRLDGRSLAKNPMDLRLAAS